MAEQYKLIVISKFNYVQSLLANDLATVYREGYEIVAIHEIYLVDTIIIVCKLRGVDNDG